MWLSGLKAGKTMLFINLRLIKHKYSTDKKICISHNNCQYIHLQYLHFK